MMPLTDRISFWLHDLRFWLTAPRASYGCRHDLVVGSPDSILYCVKCHRAWIAMSAFAAPQEGK
jgi:hypothetical protein